MVLTGSIASLNKAAVAAVKQGNHHEAITLLSQLFTKASAQHLTHPELFIAHSNKAACHLALGQHSDALQDAQQCLALLRAAAVRSGLSSPCRHPHWPKACQRLGDALRGLGQHRQAAAAYEAGLDADPFNTTLKAGLQHAQQGLLQDLLGGKALNRKALPAPPTPERITLAPHNTPSSALLRHGAAAAPSSSRQQQQLLAPGQQYAVGWQPPAAELLCAAAAVELGGDADGLQQQAAGAAADSWRLPRVLLTPAAAASDPSLRDVYEYVNTQCHVAAPKRYLHRQLPDRPRLAAWWAATTAAVAAVAASGRQPRVLLLGAKAGLLAIAAARAGAVHVTCVEQSPHLAAACRQVLLSNGLPPASFNVTASHPVALQLGRDLPCVCNCLIADIIDDGVLTGGFVPAVAHALDELLVRDNPVLVPAALTIMAQAVGVRPSGCAVGSGRKTAEREAGGEGCRSAWLDLSALDHHRWTPSQCLPSPLDPSMLLPLSGPLRLWHMPSLAVAADVSAVAQLDVEMQGLGAWCGVAVWAELQLFEDIRVSTAGPWQPAAAGSSGATTSSSSSSSAGITGCAPPSYQPALCWLEGVLAVSPGDMYPLVACHNTVRLSFMLAQADYQQLLQPQPAFPQAQFAMAADQARLSAYSAALEAAIARAAAAKQQQQQQAMPDPPGSSMSAAAAAAAAADDKPSAAVEVAVLDLGCGSGVLSLLAASTARAVCLPAAPAPETTCAVARPAAAAAQGPATGPAQQLPAQLPAAHCTPVAASVVGVELVAPLAAAALRNVTFNCGNGCSDNISIVNGDAAMLERGAQVPLSGVDVVVFDVFDAGLVGHQVLGLLERVKAKLLAEGGQLVPACATLFAIGLEVKTPNTVRLQLPGHLQPQDQQQGPSSVSSSSAGAAAGQQQQQQELALDLSALEQFRWSGEAEAVLLHLLPHMCLTRPAKVFDLDFCAPAGSSYPSEAALRLEVVAAGRLNAVALWFDLHLAEGVSLTSAPAGYTTGGRPCNSAQHSTVCSGGGSGSSSSNTGRSAAHPTSPVSPDHSAKHQAPENDRDCRAIVLHPAAVAEQHQHQQANCEQLLQQQQHQQEQQHHHHWGQALYYLDDTAAVSAGDAVQLAVQRQGAKLTARLLGGTTAQTAAAAAATSDGDGASASGSTSAGSGIAPVLQSAPRPPWLRPGAGIEDPAVWSVVKCRQLLGQMLQRAPGGKFPPIWNDLAVMQVHAGSLGLDAAVLGALSQELTMQEALAVAAARQLAVSGLVTAEAAGSQPPLMWR